MKTPNRKTLPQSIKTKAMKAVATITLWNNSVLAARAHEEAEGCPGRYEYQLVAYGPLWGQKNLAEESLQVIERTVRASMGWSAAEFYRALGTAKPIVLRDGPHIIDWREGDR